MSIRFTGDKTALRRTANLPSAHNAFTLCGFSKLLAAAPARQATLAYTQNASAASAETALLGGAFGTALRAGDNYNSTFSADVATVTAGGAAGANWFFWALVGVGSGAGGLRLYHKPVGSGSLAYQAVTNSSNADAFSAIQFGDIPIGATSWLDGLLAHLKIYNRALSDAELATEAAQAAPASSTSLISYHSFSAAAISTAVLPDQGAGTFGYQTAAPTTSADMPVFAPTLTGTDSLTAYSGPLYDVPLQQTAEQAALSNPQAMLRWSSDGGRTWSSESWSSIGRVGEYKARVRWRRLGRARDRVYELTISEPIKVAILGASIKTTRGTS